MSSPATILSKHDPSAEGLTMVDWQAVVSEHGGAVWRTAYRLLGNRADAEDCFQDAFVSALRFARREEVRDWGALLRRLATARALDRLRHRRRRSGFQGNLEDWDTVPGHNPGPEESAAGRELAGRLRRALGRLPGREAEVFCLICLEDLGRQDVARQFGISPEAVSVALHRARTRLWRLLSPGVESRK